jgi:ABC-2 type transport system permease protein
MTTTFVNDTSIVLTRELRPLTRDPFSVIFSMVQPLAFLALFGPLLPQVSGLSTGDSLQWFVPGIIVMSALFAASTTGANLQLEMQSGSHERMLVTPLRRSALLVGRALKENVIVLGQVVVIMAATVPFGFDPHPTALLGIVIVAVFAVGLGSLSYVLALKVQGAEWMFWAVQQTLLFPLMLLSGMLLPIEGGPEWMQTLSKANPLTHIVDAERALFAGDLYDSSVVWGAVAALATLAVGLRAGITAMRKAS